MRVLSRVSDFTCTTPLEHDKLYRSAILPSGCSTARPLHFEKTLAHVCIFAGTCDVSAASTAAVVLHWPRSYSQSLGEVNEAGDIFTGCLAVRTAEPSSGSTSILRERIASTKRSKKSAQRMTEATRLWHTMHSARTRNVANFTVGLTVFTMSEIGRTYVR